MQTLCDLAAFTIIHEDECLLAIHKPAGLLVHRSPIDRRETRFALQMARDRIGQRVHAVHRLDKATSSLLLFAKDAENAAKLAAQFRDGTVGKSYLALVRGWPAPSGLIDRPLRRQQDQRSSLSDEAAEVEQPARTLFQTLATTTLDRPLGRFPQQRYGLVRVSPQTGRRHQLRRHLKHINHPIVGDVNHGDRHHNHLFNDWRGYHRLYLAAMTLELRHPRSGALLTLTAPLQSDFEATLRALSLSAGPLSVSSAIRA